jgi:RNA polymerase sigma-70 factor (ECF subfamily)
VVTPAPHPPTPLEEQLAAARAAFLRFVRARIADPELAEDILQDALLRAVQSSATVRDEDRLVPWFYRILRNAITDAYRRRDVERRRSTPLGEIDLPAELDEDADRTLCECFRELLPTLRPEYAEVLEAADLGGATTEALTAQLGITPNNLKVRRHRARAALRTRLQETCRLCADHGCLDCTCGGSPP